MDRNFGAANSPKDDGWGGMFWGWMRLLFWVGVLKFGDVGVFCDLKADICKFS